MSTEKEEFNREAYDTERKETEDDTLSTDEWRFQLAGAFQAISTFQNMMPKVPPMINNAERFCSVLSDSIKPMVEANKLWSSLSFTPSVQYCWENLAQSFMKIEPISSSLRELSSAVSKFVESFYATSLPQITVPVFELFQSVSYFPSDAIREAIKSFDFTAYWKRLNHILLHECYDAKWVPNAVWNADPDFLTDVLEIINTTKKSKNRVKKIDKAILTYYTKSRIETIKKSWRVLIIPEYSMRMMHQAVQAYHRKEYALTIVMLSTMWEGIIYAKVNDNRGKNGNRTKQNFAVLSDQNNCDLIFQSFFNEYIMYDCRSTSQVIEDVPGRNSSAHSWYNKYPSRKAALNAILFTDYLLKLNPVYEEAAEENAHELCEKY